MKLLSSKWGALSPKLIAQFYVCDREGNPIDGEPIVLAPLGEGATFEQTVGWTSAFENAGTQASFPAVSNLAQSGALVPLAERAEGYFESMASSENLIAGAIGRTGQAVFGEASDGLASLQGRNSVTKLNSTQIYCGSQPFKLNLTLVFRAWEDPVTEVEQPIRQLLAWSVPRDLADGGFLAGAGQNQGGIGEQLFPSLNPPLIAMRYANDLYAPLVIEGFSEPITSPRTYGGWLAECQLQLQLTSYRAIDRQDVDRIYRFPPARSARG